MEKSVRLDVAKVVRRMVHVEPVVSVTQVFAKRQLAMMELLVQMGKSVMPVAASFAHKMNNAERARFARRNSARKVVEKPKIVLTTKCVTLVLLRVLNVLKLPTVQTVAFAKTKLV